MSPRLLCLPLCSFLSLSGLAAIPAPGDLVRLTRSETLLFKGENFIGAPKGQEFTVLQADPAHQAVYVEYYKKDDSRVALTLPVDALEPSPAEGWSDLLRGTEAFRDGRYEASRALVARAAQDPKYKPLAAALAARFTGAAAAYQGAPAALPAVVQGLREVAAALCKEGNLSLGLATDLGADRLAARAPGAAGTRLDRADITKRVATVTRAAARARQAYALHRTKEASGFIKEALEAEPSRADLVALERKISKDLSEAGDRLADADRMRKIPKGEVHALTALQLGLKLAVDHPGLQALKAEMQGALEDRTAPPLTPTLLKAARASTPVANLELGRKLYTTKCVECHDLEMVDSRSVSNWEKMVGNMSSRAHLNGEQKGRIMEYLTVAVNGVGNE